MQILYFTVQPSGYFTVTFSSPTIRFISDSKVAAASSGVALDVYKRQILDGAKGADGVQYGVPFSTDTQCLWYDKKLMEEAGVSVPFQPKNCLLYTSRCV